MTSAFGGQHSIQLSYGCALGNLNSGPADGPGHATASMPAPAPLLAGVAVGARGERLGRVLDPAHDIAPHGFRLQVAQQHVVALGVESEALAPARGGGGPTLIECKVNRYYGHFEGDAQTYRAEDEVKKVRENRDCIENFAHQTLTAGLVNKDELASIDREISALVDEAVIEAKAAPKPGAEDLLTDVYESY